MTSHHCGPVVAFLLVTLASLAACSSDETLSSSVDSGDRLGDASSEIFSLETGAESRESGLCGGPRWNVRSGGNGPTDPQALDGALAVAVDPSGNVLVTGNYVGDADFGGGPRPGGANNVSMFLAKLDVAGHHVWSKGFGDSGEGAVHAPTVQGYAVAADSNSNVVVAGTMSGVVDLGGGALKSTDVSAADGGQGLGDGGQDDAGLRGGCRSAGSACSLDAIVAKYDASGAHLWSRVFGAEGTQAVRAVAFDTQGNVYLAGTFDGTINLGGASLASTTKSDGFLAKLDPDGHHLWSVSVSGAAIALAVDSAGNLIVTGVFSETAMFGATALKTAGTFDGFVMKVDSTNGHVLWAKQSGTTNVASNQRVAVDKRDNTIATVGIYMGSIDWGTGPLQSAGSWDVFVAKLDTSGSLAWVKSYGGAGYDGGSGIAFDQSGHILLAGQVGAGGSIDFGGGPLGGGSNTEAFVAELDSTSAHLCSHSHGGPASATDVAVDAQGHVVMAGSFTDKLDLGLGPMVSSGGQDIFVGAFDR